MTLLQHYFRVRQALTGRYRRYLNNHARSVLQRYHKELRNVIDAYDKCSIFTGCSYSDYTVLYNWVRRNKPKEILECGTGISTAVMAYALMENEKEDGEIGRITSMEEDENYYQHARGLMPTALRRHVEFVLSPTVEDVYSIFRGMRYRDTPERPYEFVFIDGPSIKAPSDNTMTFDFDLIRIVEKSQNPVSAIIDMRRSTCFVFSHVFGNKFSYRYKQNLGFIGPCSKEDLRSADVISQSLKNYPLGR